MCAGSISSGGRPTCTSGTSSGTRKIAKQKDVSESVPESLGVGGAPRVPAEPVAVLRIFFLLKPRARAKRAREKRARQRQCPLLHETSVPFTTRECVPLYTTCNIYDKIRCINFNKIRVNVKSISRPDTTWASSP
jgi:hypothetical protein